MCQATPNSAYDDDLVQGSAQSGPRGLSIRPAPTCTFLHYVRPASSLDPTATCPARVFSHQMPQNLSTIIDSKQHIFAVRGHSHLDAVQLYFDVFNACTVKMNCMCVCSRVECCATPLTVWHEAVWRHCAFLVRPSTSLSGIHPAHDPKKFADPWSSVIVLVNICFPYSVGQKFSKTAKWLAHVMICCFFYAQVDFWVLCWLDS